MFSFQITSDITKDDDNFGICQKFHNLKSKFESVILKLFRDQLLWRYDILSVIFWQILQIESLQQWILLQKCMQSAAVINAHESLFLSPPHNYRNCLLERTKACFPSILLFPFLAFDTCINWWAEERCQHELFLSPRMSPWYQGAAEKFVKINRWQIWVTPSCVTFFLPVHSVTLHNSGGSSRGRPHHPISRVLFAQGRQWTREPLHESFTR